MTHTEIHPYMEPKKYKHADLLEYRLLFLSLGLTTSLLLVILAFQIKTKSIKELTQLANTNIAIEEILEIPPTTITPPPPTIQLPKITEVPDELEILEEVVVNFDIEISTDTKLEEIVLTAPSVVEDDLEKADQIFIVVEESAVPKGGMAAFYKMASENLHYPAQARRMNVEGKVFIEFVVDKEGKIGNIVIVKGIGAGCDEEAIRILKLSPDWQPAKQRGKPVKQRIVLPIFFKLAKP